MTRARALLVVAVCGVALAWFTATGRVAHPHAASVSRAPADLTAAKAVEAMGGQAARLRTRLAAERALRPSERNPFEFRARSQSAAASSAPRAAGTSRPPTLAHAERPEMQLLGIAEDPSPDGPVRTAVMSAMSQLFVVKEGERVLGRFQVVRVAADAVELRDGEKSFTLALK